MTHNALQKLVVAYMTKYGNGFNVVSSNKRGRPDIIGHIMIVFLAVEVKVGRDVLRPAQRKNLLEINRKGGLGVVVHEKHFDIFTKYVDTIVLQINQGTPYNQIGRPIPPELEVKDFENVVSIGATAV